MVNSLFLMSTLVDITSAVSFDFQVSQRIVILSLIDLFLGELTSLRKERI